MLTLSLLRHAKSSWNNPAVPDHDRPLATRGVVDAPLMGRAMTERGIDPDLVLCSSARRTRDTLALVLPELKVGPKVVYEDALYHASAAEMLELMRAVPPGASRLMLVGHNPEIHALALDLVGSGPKHYRDKLKDKYPTAGLVVVNFTSGAWQSVTVNSGELKLFLTPKDLKP
jgi:phosphohistidine phosphatase